MNTPLKKRPVVVEIKRRKTLGFPAAKNDNIEPAAVIDHGVVSAIAASANTTTGTALTVVPKETDHAKVFRLIREGDLKLACRLAAKLVNAGEDEGLFIYGSNPAYRHAASWFQEQVLMAKKGILTVAKTITPELAQVMLQHNDGNRRVNAKNLEDIMRDMMSDRWDMNGENVKVSKDGLLNDAQHRNFAILLAGVSIKTLITFGLQRDTRKTVDTGMKRKASDRASIRGESDAVVASATAALAFEVYCGRKGTPMEIDDYLIEHSDEIHAAIVAKGSMNINGIGPSSCAVAAMHLLRLGAQPDDIRDFLKIVRTGLTPKNTDAARAIYNAMHPTTNTVKPEKMQREQWVSTLCHHFVMWSRGKPQRTTIKNLPLPEKL